jgi:antimicrobial peptide system SdpB family protein
MQLIFGELRRAHLSHTIDSFDLRFRRFTTLRAVFALAQLSVIAFTPYDALMQTVGDRDGPNCEGLRVASAYCFITPGSMPGWVATSVIAIVLLLVVAGVAPTWTALPHAWASFSIASTISLPDGGDQAAAVFSILLIAASVGDDRRWAWSQTVSPVSSTRRQVSLAGLMCMRVQVAAIYLNAAIAKLFETDWTNGTAEFYILRDPFFGASGPIGDLMRGLSDSAVVTVGMTWGAIVVELCIAVLILCGPTSRSIAFGLSIALHGAIIATIGLWSFGLVMIAAVGIAATPVTAQERARTVVASVRGRRLAARLGEATS